ncbi:hypothetical protein ColLi_04038 [Colletotrichum liriopes]|uniref:Cupin type-2 domain-containing protein n=1 Tax=Colletotrichum liriopes TaxID=708192 RepID=A0AA37GHT7_9PEZI|nr:hypothetical protein ColLi_04038 [Colletotrichum liriopes]
MSSPPQTHDPLPAPRRIITTHNASGQAVLETSIPEPLPKTPLPGADTYLAYTATSIPVPLAADADLATYKSHLPHNVGVAIPGGLVARVVDFPPGGAGAPLHRTETVDTGVVVDGELELFLDSGETAALGKGDVFVQRGTIHGWRNRSESAVARLFVVLTAADMPVVGGKRLEEEITIPDLKAK